jgi:hypothetical protein
MFNTSASISDINHALQLALAPVFLLTGVAGILNVMAGRLARIIDRGRHVTEGNLRLDLAARQAVREELLNLERRRHLASWAINACTFAALLVCTVIATLFAEALLELPLQWLAGVLFTGSTAALIIGLASFLREVRLANQTVRIPVSLLEGETNAVRSDAA